jgi:predicted nucleic acid-binding protein
MKKCLIDAGPLIALFDKDDLYHRPMSDFLQKFRGELFTSWAVITEVMHMLDFHLQAQLDFLKWIARGAVSVAQLDAGALPKIIQLIEKYADRPMDLADATLLVLAELENCREIISLDAGFLFYRNIYGLLQNIYPGSPG